MPRGGNGGGGGKAHRPYSRKYTGLDGGGPGDIGSELGRDHARDGDGFDAELHTKMSKKIAQLTKVRPFVLVCVFLVECTSK